MELPAHRPRIPLGAVYIKKRPHILLTFSLCFVWLLRKKQAAIATSFFLSFFSCSCLMPFLSVYIFYYYKKQTGAQRADGVGHQQCARVCLKKKGDRATSSAQAQTKTQTRIASDAFFPFPYQKKVGCGGPCDSIREANRLFCRWRQPLPLFC
nr:hypothetical protein [Pandoravirus belohorizontensis]